MFRANRRNACIQAVCDRSEHSAEPHKVPRFFTGGPEKSGNQPPATRPAAFPPGAFLASEAAGPRRCAASRALSAGLHLLLLVEERRA